MKAIDKTSDLVEVAMDYLSDAAIRELAYRQLKSDASKAMRDALGRQQQHNGAHKCDLLEVLRETCHKL